MTGRFITFEGPEGCGKSTQARRLAAYLEGEGVETVVTREPGGTRVGEAVREILQHDAAGGYVAEETETLLFLACRAQLVREVIRPALARGACVVSDRSLDSTTAYQGYGRSLDVETIVGMNTFAVGDTVPDLTILIEIAVQKGFDRLAARNLQRGTGFDRIERETILFHERVREGYLALARRYADRFRVVDGDRDPDAVEADVRDLVRGLACRDG